jgi:hypothetical protein
MRLKAHFFVRVIAATGYITFHMCIERLPESRGSANDIAPRRYHLSYYICGAEKLLVGHPLLRPEATRVQSMGHDAHSRALGALLGYGCTLVSAKLSRARVAHHTIGPDDAPLHRTLDTIIVNV